MGLLVVIYNGNRSRSSKVRKREQSHMDPADHMRAKLLGIR